MAGRNEFKDEQELEELLREIVRRLERLERLAFLGFQETREVATYAYESSLQDPEQLKPLTWTRQSFHPISDDEAKAVGLRLNEIGELKMATRILRRQIRLDALGIVRDMVRQTRASYRLRDSERAA